MKIFTPPFYSRKINFLLLGGLILFLSCQSDPIVYNPTGGYEYQKKSFQINDETSETVQGSLHTGMSPRLYSGILSNGETVSTLIRLLPEVLDSHEVCGSDNIINVDILLTSITPIAVKEDTTIIDTLIQFDALKTYLIAYDVFDEDVVLTDDIINNIKGLTNDILPNVELNTNSIELNLLAHESTIIKKWCEDKEDLGVVISYIPTDSTYLEFYSSNGSEVGLGPKLSLKYSIEEETSKSHTRYLINEVFWEDEQMKENMNGPYFVDDSLSGYWGTIYAISLDRGSQIITNPPLAYDSVTVQTDIVSAGQNFPLVTIDLELNPEVVNDIDSISFSILNAFAFMNKIDPAGDNWNEETNPDSTENNDTYDDGELFNDYGIDNCADELEDELGGCVLPEEERVFNSEGTETNGQLDWTDNVIENGAWDLGEGEEWFDVGIDGCSDIYEFGENSCGTVENSQWSIGVDLNGDNYINDPVGDDWSLTNLNGTEDNGSWDSSEPYKDWGTDGLPASLAGDIDDNGTEGNGSYDLGEPFDDTGNDGAFNENEFGYNAVGTEGNNAFDGEGEFLDCGEDNICNDVEGDDDYNIDPNGDNWSATDSTSIGTEGNDLLDDGEEWFDWGLDGIQDSLEAFQVSSVISIERYDNSYIFDLDEEILTITPDLETDTVSLWISEIQKVDENSLNIEVSVQSNKALKGLQFQLYHTPFTKVDTTLETYTPSIAQLGEDKLFEDFTLLPKENYSDEELNDQLLIEYSNDLSTFLDFASLNLFLENEEYIFSHQYSNLVFYIDTPNTDIHEDGMWVYLTHSSDSGEGKTLSVPIEVTSSSDSVEIPIGHILSAYQSGSIGSYNGLQLRADDNLYNYSKLSIKNNPRIDVMYSQ